jgi:hypothetical protein
LLIAAFNEGAPTPIVLRISAQTLGRVGLGSLKASSVFVLGKDGHPLTGGSARTVNIAGLEVKATLGTGEGLLYQAIAR